MSQDEKKEALTPAERKRLQRQRDKSQGYVEITVRVPEDRIDDARLYCSKLKPSKRKSDKSQIDMFAEAAE